MKLPRPARRRARIEIIPMIDAIFFLLVFFMYSSLSMVHVKGMGLALPRPAPQSVTPVVTDANKLVVTVTAEGVYQLNGVPTLPENLLSTLQQRAGAQPDMVVILNVAPARTTQDLIGVLDTVSHVTRPGGGPLPVLVATGAIDAQGRALLPGKE
ncbi:MAG TPA: biopolymer transporter ExbD [Armatimonadota bacterium]|jgi:biopolymer transport protein ExbD